MKEFLELMAWLCGFLTPPAHDADPQRVWRWRVKVAVITMANSVTTVICAALALGALPTLFAGFASQTTVQTVQQQLASVQSNQQQQLVQVQRNQLDSKIMETRTRQCAAMKLRDKGNGDAEAVLSFATERIQEELEDFWRLTHRRYRLPDCSEV